MLNINMNTSNPMASSTAEFKVTSEEGSVIPTVSDVRVNPTTVRAGSRFNVTYKIGNKGTSTMTGTATTSFSCPGNVCIRDTTSQVRPVPPGGSTQGSTQAMMPANATKGSYKVTVTYTPRGTPGIKPTPPVRGTLRTEMS